MPRTPGPSLTLDDIAAAGIRVLERVGLRGFSLSAVAAELGVKPPSLYHHVDGLRGLREVVAIEGWASLVRSMPPLPNQPRQVLVALAHGYRDFALGHPQLYTLMTEEPMPVGSLAVQSVTGEALQLLSSLAIPHQDSVHLLRGLRSVVHGFVQLELAGQFQPAVPATQSFDWMIDVVLRGLLPPPE